MAWGDKGEEYRPDKCNHPSNDGCEWCCRTCNYDRHFCPGCGTVSDHFETPCDGYCVMISVYRSQKIKLIRPINVQVWPMWQKCRECNYDRHRCYGCGAPVRHYNKSQVCSGCVEIYALSKE